MPEWIGKTIGNVRIEKYLARGGMAEVYLGIHQTLDRPVAVKVLHAFIEEDPDLLMRFQREAKVVAGLRHTNIVQVFDFDTVDSHPYIVMEYLKGPSLAAYLKSLHERNERIPSLQVAHLLKSLASALDYAHGQGVIHRDIKPGNILFHSKTKEISLDHPLPDDVDVILTDFGLVRIAHSATQTASGLISGTPAYMAPEQARGDKVDHRADIYSLGVVLYEMLAGRVPFEGDSTLTVIYKHINEPPPPIEGISAAVQTVIDRALAKDPNDRYQTARDLALDFSRAINQNAVEETSYTVPTPTPQPAETSKKRNPALGPILIGGAVLVCGCLAVALLGGLGMSFLPIVSNTTVTVTQPPATIVATETVAPPTPTKEKMAMSMPTEVGSLGVLRFQNDTAMLDQITISATLAPPAQGTQYEAWLISDSGEQRRSLGLLAQNASGQFTLTYVDPQSRNLLDGFGSMEITVEPNPDDSPNPTTDVAYSSAIPKGSLMHIRHLLVRMEDNPNHIGMVVGLVNDAKLIDQSAQAMLEAYTSGDTKSVHSNAEAIINLIVGKQDSELYKDWDSDGKINDPGDGYGLLLNGDQAGYVGGVIDHAQLSAESPDSTPVIRMHSGHVIICAQNVEDWAIQLRDIAIRVAQSESDEGIEADVRSAVTLANQMLDGIDINGNEAIDPIPGEGGAITAYEHADYMSDMPIMAGENQIPATGQ
jgi:tRNA A-37 threonylcarbamoyl transferase component Bud32